MYKAIERWPGDHRTLSVNTNRDNRESTVHIVASRQEGDAFVIVGMRLEPNDALSFAKAIIDAVIKAKEA